MGAETGENRITGMIANRPGLGRSRASAPGAYPSPCSCARSTTTTSRKATSCGDEAVNAAIADAFEKEGADAWFAAGSAERFLAAEIRSSEAWEQVRDVLDVWFDSGSTHAFILEDPAAFPGLAGIKRVHDGGPDKVMYLEGSDQHRGWFHSSLLECCGTRGRAPFDVVLTHGFILDEKGDEKCRSRTATCCRRRTVIKKPGADILRLWVGVRRTTAQRYAHRTGHRAVHFAEAYRKLRNTIRWMLGALAPVQRRRSPSPGRKDLPELESLMLHRLAELDEEVRARLRRPSTTSAGHRRAVAPS